MDKKKFLRRIFDVHVWAVAIAIIGVTTAIAAITLTTFHPAPYGEYNILRCITSGGSFGRVESDAYFDEPSGYGTASPPSYWMNINGYQISSGGSVLGPPTTTNTNVASRLPVLGVKQLFDVDNPPVADDVWAPILDMNGQSKLQDLEINGVLSGREGQELVFKGDLVIDGDLTCKNNLIVGNTTHTYKLKPYPGQSGIHDVSYFDQLHCHGTVRKHRCEAFVDTKEGNKFLTAIESPEVRLIDEGKAQLQNGIAKIEIDKIFKDTIEANDYNVFLTLQGDCKGIWVSEKTPDYFIVKEIQNGKSNTGFTWMLSGVRKGFEGVRFE